MDFKEMLNQKNLDKDRFYLIVAGSRDFTPTGSLLYTSNDGDCIIRNYDVAEALIDKMISTQITMNREIRIVQGGAKGADEIGKQYAKYHDYWCKEFKTDWDRYGKAAGFYRNEDMFFYISTRPNKGAILFWDGESKGTRNDFLQARNYNVRVVCYNFIEKRWLTDEEIKEIQEDEYAQWIKYTY